MRLPVFPSPLLRLVPLWAALPSTWAGVVLNPSFEANYNNTWPHYTDIEGWIKSGGNSGVNNTSGPFHNTGTAIPDQSRAGLLQGAGSLSQTLSGLEAGQRYWLQYFHDVRTGSDLDFTVTWDGTPIDAVAGAVPSATGHYRFRNAVFETASDSGTVAFTTTVRRDSTLLLDGICVVRRDEGEVFVQNPGFEASGPVADAGTVTQLAGWTVSGHAGVNPAAGPYADNGTVPEQDQVLFLQQNAGISQVLKGLVPGEAYTVSVRCNARTGNSPRLAVQVAGQEIYSGEVTPVGGDAPYRTVSASFTAEAGTAEIVFAQTVADGDHTLLLDDIRVSGEFLPPVPDLIIGPASVELAPDQVGVVSVTVDGERLAQGESVVRLRSTSSAVADFEGIDPGGEKVLTFDAGLPTTTLTAEIRGLSRGRATIEVVDNGGHDGVQGGAAVEVVNSLVRNASFEGTAAPSGAGYGAFTGWNQSSTASSGLNTGGMPFASDGRVPDRGQVAFFQGSNTLSQTVYGLTPGNSYQLQFHFNARVCCGGIPTIAAMIDGMEIARIADIQPAVGGLYFHAAPFVPQAETVELAFQFSVNGGDGSALLDAVSIVERPLTDITVVNPSFEASGLAPGAGYLNPASIAGWTMTGTGYGLNVDGLGPFTDNGLAGAQDRVLFLQNQTAAAQTVGGLTAGQPYTLSLLMNARNGDQAGGTPWQVLVDNVILEEGVQDPVGAGMPYALKSWTFEAGAETAEIVIRCNPPGTDDQTLLIDEVRVFPAAAGGAVELTASPLAGNSIVLKWPSAADPSLVLMSSLTMQPGSWTAVTSPVTPEGGFNTVVETFSGQRRFYALFRP